jgi:hypothetical protein
MTDQAREEGKTCFVAMPITTPAAYFEKYGDQDHFVHVLDHLFRPALQEMGFAVISPAVLGAELIHAEIIKNLEQADFVLCDLSSLNPNVFFELGIRTSLDRPLALVKDDLTSQIPFDLNAINTLTYDGSLTPWSLAAEVPRLVGHLRSAVDSQTQGNAMWRYFGLTKRASPSESGTNPLEAKLDLLIGEVAKSQLSSVQSLSIATPGRVVSTNVIQKVAAILADNGIHTFSSRDERGEMIVSIPNRPLSVGTRHLLGDLARDEGISILIESPSEIMKF